MNHISEDALLSFVLDTSENPSERAAIATHLAACAECRAQLARAKHDVDILTSLQPRGGILQVPFAQRRRVPLLALLKAATLVAVGFALGLGTADRTRHEPACVSPAYVNVSPPPDTLRLCAVADATALSVETVPLSAR